MIQTILQYIVILAFIGLTITCICSGQIKFAIMNGSLTIFYILLYLPIFK